VGRISGVEFQDEFRKVDRTQARSRAYLHLRPRLGFVLQFRILVSKGMPQSGNHKNRLGLNRLAFSSFPFITQGKDVALHVGAAPADYPLPYTLVERLFLLRQSATTLAQERAFPPGMLTLVGGLIVPPEENQQQ
jgi:hypothetical protein